MNSAYNAFKRSSDIGSLYKSTEVSMKDSKKSWGILRLSQQQCPTLYNHFQTKKADFCSTLNTRAINSKVGGTFVVLLDVASKLAQQTESSRRFKNISCNPR